MTTSPRQEGSRSPTGRLPFLVRAGYGGFGGAERVVEGAYYAFFLFFLTDVIGLNPITAGTVMLVGSISDGISDLFAGIFSDRLETRWGRRRPILLAIALPYGVASWMLFTDFGLTGSTRVLYFCAIVALFYAVSDFVVVPGKALGAEMSLDYDERTSINGYRMLWSFAGNAAGTACVLLVAGYFTERLGDERAGWSAMAACLGVVAILPILLTWRVTRGYEIRPQNKTPFSLRDVWTPLVTNRVFRYVLGFTTLAATGQYFFHGSFVYYMTYWMGYDKSESSYVYGVLGICGFAWVPVVTRLGRGVGKRTAVVLLCGLAIVAVGGLWMVQPGQQLLLIVCATAAVSSLGLSYAMLGGAMIADAVEVEEFKTGQRREGYYYAMAAVGYKAAISIVYWVIGMALDWIGYQPGAEQSAEALTGIRLLVSMGPAVGAILAIIVALRSPMTRKRHQALLSALEEKKQGKEPDVSSIRELLA